MTRQVLTEATTSTTAASTAPVAGQPGRFLVQLISPGWGSSGYYSPDVLEAAANARVFPAGLQMFLDHEHLDGSGLDLHGNRSVKDLAAVLESDASWNGQALVATARVFGPYREALSQAAESIGVSIRAAADVQPGEAEGQNGLIITELVEGLSADFVTRAGRGGKILQVIESARVVTEARNIGQWIESRIHRDFTVTADDMAGDGYLTREERITLSGAIGDALAAFVTRVEADAPQLYTRDLWDDPQDTIATAMEALKNVPAPRSDEHTTQEENMPEIAESELRTLREAAGRVQTLESERDAAVTRAETAESERDEAVTERDQLREAENGRTREATIGAVLTAAVEAAHGIALNEYERAGVTARAVVNDGTVDEAATRTAFDTALAAIAESRGQGRPRGLGGTVQTGESATDLDAELDQISEAAFGPAPTGTTVKEA